MFAEILAFLSVFQQPYFGGCPKDIKFQPDIHYQPFFGRWYEHSRYPNFIQNSNRCTSVDVEAQSDTQKGFFVHATIVDPLNGAMVHWSTPFFVGGAELLSIPADNYIRGLQKEIIDFHEFDVLSTDYENYVIVYSCYELNVLPLVHTRLVWIMTRDRVPSNETLQVVHNILTENNLSVDLLVKTDQDNCDEGVDD